MPSTNAQHKCVPLKGFTREDVPSLLESKKIYTKEASRKGSPLEYAHFIEELTKFFSCEGWSELCIEPSP